MGGYFIWKNEEKDYNYGVSSLLLDLEGRTYQNDMLLSEKNANIITEEIIVKNDLYEDLEEARLTDVLLYYDDISIKYKKNIKDKLTLKENILKKKNGIFKLL